MAVASGESGPKASAPPSAGPLLPLAVAPVIDSAWKDITANGR